MAKSEGPEDPTTGMNRGRSDEELGVDSLELDGDEDLLLDLSETADQVHTLAPEAFTDAELDNNYDTVVQELYSTLQDRDPEIAALFQEFLNTMSTVACFGGGRDRIPTKMKKDLQAVLTGMTMLIQKPPLTKGEHPKQLQPQSQIPHVKHFLEMVEQHVGQKNDDGSMTLHMKIHPNQRGSLHMPNP